MNAPLPEAVRKALESVTLDDKYALESGRAFMSGVQALVRLPMLQRKRDAMFGLNTAGFVSGYRGSPLGGYDQALWAAKKHLAAQNIVFQPGVNEELAATAVWGTQQLELYPQTKKFDGVFGIWYGKGPGVDRCSDVFKHANLAGTSKHGGVIAIAGDDHIAKSSTAAHQSDHIFKACGLPVFFPSSVQDILDMGLHAFAMSRFAGVWSAMKTIQEIVESSASISVDPDRVDIILPEDFRMPAGGLHIRWPDAPLEQEARLMDYKWYAALAYVRANRLNHNVIEGPNDRFGIIASGKGYNDARQALHDLGLDDDVCRRIGLRLHKVNVVWPLEATITRDFAEGLQEILVVEEKRQVIEYQLKEELYGWRPDVRPNVLGKFDEARRRRAAAASGARPTRAQHWLLRAQADLTPAIIAKAIAKRLGKLGVDADIAAGMAMRIALIDAKEKSLAVATLNSTGANATGERAPWFCSGCPHNTSHQGARRLARRRRHRLPLHGGLDGPLDRHLQPDGRRRRVVGRPGAVHDREAHLRQPRRRHLLPLGPARGAPGDRRQGQHHLQDPLQRRGRDDRRPAGRRHDEGARDDARARRRGRGQGRRRHRRAGEVRGARDPRAARAERHGAPPRRARRRSRSSCARSPAARSSSTTRPARPRSAGAGSAARWKTRPSASSSTSWSAKAAATARCRATASRSSRSRPSSAASAASTRTPATRTTPA